MTDLPTPTARRLKAPSWRDSRLIIGVVLVLAATALGAYVVQRADDRVGRYAAARQIAPGEAVTADALTRVEVQLDVADRFYLSADRPLAPDLRALRDLRPGELVPTSAVGTPAQAGTQELTLQVDETTASALVRGSIVDVYVNRPKAGATATVGNRDLAGPERALERVSVVSVSDGGGGLGGSSSTRSVRVMVPTDKVEGLVGDVDLGARITLVPVPGSVTGGSS